MSKIIEKHNQEVIKKLSHYYECVPIGKSLIKNLVYQVKLRGNNGEDVIYIKFT